MEKLFAEWLKNNTNLSDSSIGKYTRAIRAITKDMIAERIIDKDLYNIKSPIELTSFSLIRNPVNVSGAETSVVVT